MSESDRDESTERRAVVLDYLAHGHSTGGRRQYDRSPTGYALDEDDFGLYEVAFDEDERLTIGTRVVIEPADARTVVEDAWPVEYDALSSTGQASSTTVRASAGSMTTPG